MTNLPPSAQPMPIPVPSRTSKAAVTSLIFGILFCIPVIAPAIAIIAGLVGLSKTKQPGVNGGGMAIAGLILGFVGILCTIGVLGAAGVAFMGYRSSGTGVFATFKEAMAEGRDGATTTTGLMNDIAGGNIESALSRCTSSISREYLQKLHDQVADLGTLHGVNINKTEFTKTTSGGMEGHFGGKLNFDKGIKQFNVRVIMEAGTVKVDGVSVNDFE